MDLSAVASAITLIQTQIYLIQELIKIARRIVSYQYVSLERDYGRIIVFLLVVIFPGDTAKQHRRVERVILMGGDEETLAFRQAVTDECNMTAIAGAIIAQVAITGLSLPSLSSTHWLARAFFLFAVTSGCVSVYHSCVLQRTIGKLYQPQLIREWLSLPPEKGHLGEEGGTKRASLAAVFIVSAPFNMVKASIFAFLTGLAIYQGFTWTRAFDTSAGHGDSRDVFIAFIVSTGWCTLFFLLTDTLKTIENLLRTGRSGRDDPDGIAFHEGSELPQLMTRPPDHPEHPRRGADEVEGLPAALEAAAQAHIQCAEAERRVAVEYSRLFQATRDH